MAASSPASQLDIVATIRGWTVEAVLAEPQRVDRSDPDAREFCAKNRQALEPGLLRKAVDFNAKDRLEIGILLLEMGAASGSPLLLNSLHDPDPEIVRQGLLFLQTMRWQRDKGLLLPLDRTAAVEALLPFLSATDPRARKSAVQAICRLSGSDLVDLLRQLLTHEGPQIEAEAALHLAMYHGDAAAWPLLQTLLLIARSHRRYRIINCLTGYSVNLDREIKNQVATVARGELATLYRLQDNNAANEAYNWLQVLRELAPPWENDVFEEVIASKLASWVKAVAIERLAMREEGTSAGRRILALLDDPTMVDHTLAMISKMGAAANTPAIADKLRAELRNATTEKRLAGVVDAFLAIGGKEVGDLGAVVDRTDGWRRFEIVTRRDCVSAEALLDHLERAGLLLNASAAARSRFTEGWRGASRVTALMSVLGEEGRLYVFDCEDGGVPPDYVGLLGGSITLSWGAIAVGKASLATASPTKYHLTADINGWPDPIELENQGDWFDVGGLLSGLNRLLSALHSPLRYYTLHAAGQVVSVILANVKAMESLISDFAFPIGDPQEARRLGQEYELFVVNKIAGASSR